MEGKNPVGQASSTKWTDLPPIPDALTHSLAESEIHLWLIHLDIPPETLLALAGILSPDETARAERFRFQHLRNRYTTARGAVRQILALYLRMASGAVRFQYSGQGKPSLPDEINPAQLSFNVSHSKSLAMLAIAQDKRVGIDLEYREAKRDLEQIALHNFSPREADALFSLPEDQRTNAFYACWTLKEAYLKATGDGLSTPLDRFEVRFPPVAPARLASVVSSPDGHLRWRAYSLTVEDHAAALIAEGQQHTLRRAAWNP